MTTLDEAFELLRWAQRALDTHESQQLGVGDPELVSYPVVKPGVASSMTPQMHPLAGLYQHQRRIGIATPRYGELAGCPALVGAPPPVLVHGAGPMGWRVDIRGAADAWNQPRGELIYPKAWNVAPHPPSFDPDNELPPKFSVPAGSRVFRIGIGGPGEPATIGGTHKLAVAAYIARTLATELDAVAGLSGRADTTRRLGAESHAYREHANACVAALEGSLAWLNDFERNLTPIPPFAPILIPAQLRGYITVSPI